MIEIIAGTNRPGSRTLTVAKHVLNVFKELKANVNLIDLSTLNLSDLASGDYYKGANGHLKQNKKKKPELSPSVPPDGIRAPLSGNARKKASPVSRKEDQR